jgi:hypothetical protein
MCLIARKPSGIQIQMSWLENAADRNPDGVGLMCARKGKIHIVRDTDSSEVRRLVSSFKESEDVFIHVRYATHGKTDLLNCHPFLICNGRFAVMHNGVIAGIDCTSNEDRSDTYHFCHSILAPVLAEDEDLILKPDFIKGVGELVGKENKLAILRSDGASCIINEGQWTLRDGILLSNTYSIEDPWQTRFSGFPEVSRGTAKGGKRGKRDRVEIDLESLAECTQEDIVDIIEQYPYEVAQAIEDYFGWRTSSSHDASERDYR